MEAWRCILTLLATFALCASTTAAADLFTAYSSHTDGACTSVPKQIAYVPSVNCSTTNTCASDSSDTKSTPYVTQDCTTDLKKLTATRFASNPWIQFEIYSPGSGCATLVSAIAYLADGSCLIVDNATSSIIATVNTNGSATISTYEGVSCDGSPTKRNLIAKDDLQKTTCLEGVFLVYTSDVTSTKVTTGSSATRLSGRKDALHIAITALSVVLVAAFAVH
ncbi:hypothetical protein Poli38472_011941 [Pythium oligandrum]|uniref:Uncharacterized protein n=1 Tax=Pythium oligandrum TaxID=41045 RepID=A0A8K1FK76_PYTOL|nr:hypothetical protein Poli38472_011941 [Pythium oligandrum]|eukprot:TMW66825.1 hypothetical protein Poli38472_011941 [Pythium oligandrum]